MEMVRCAVLARGDDRGGRRRRRLRARRARRRDRSEGRHLPRRLGGEPQSFWGTDGFDPTVEYEDGVRAIHTNLVVRTLVGYDHVAGPAGMRIVPDLAVRVPTPDERRPHVQLHAQARDPVRAAGQPRDQSRRDIRYAIERLARPEERLGLLGYYFSLIEGFDAYRAGKASSIAGISTPSPKTIVFTLSRPVGDFLHRLALPAAGPIPRRGGPLLRGQARAPTARDVVSSGPVHDRGRGRGQARLVRRHAADARDLAGRARARPQPELRPCDGHEGGAGEQSRPVRLRAVRDHARRSSGS